jgi:hypothetical protein
MCKTKYVIARTLRCGLRRRHDATATPVAVEAERDAMTNDESHSPTMGPCFPTTWT